MYSIKTAIGPHEIKAGDKLGSLDGVSNDFYVVDVIPLPTTCLQPTLIQPDSVTCTPQFFSSGNVITGPSFNFKAQIDIQHRARHTSTQGAETPKSKGSMVALTARGTIKNKLIEIHFADSLEALMFPDAFCVQYIPAPTLTGGDSSLMIEPTETAGTPINLEIDFIDLSEQFLPINNARTKLGDAMIKFTRDQLSEEMIQTNGSYFLITPVGSKPILFHVWGSEGVRRDQAFHWTVYLERVRRDP